MDYKVKFLRDGNTKLGDNMATWSTLKGDDDYYIPELDRTVKGTCGKYCAGCKHACYVTKSYNRYTSRKTGKCSVKLGHARNTIMLRENINKVYNDLHNQIARARNPFDIIRLNQSGELENKEQFNMFCQLGRDFDYIREYIYTKAYDIVIPMILDGLVPQNVTVLISIWHEQGIEEYKKVAHYPNVKAFVYMDGFDYSAYGLEVQTMCAAYDENGKMDHNVTCDKCKKCFNRLTNCKVIGCYDH